MNEKYLLTVTTRENWKHEATRKQIEHSLARALPANATVVNSQWLGTTDLDLAVWGPMCRYTIVYTEGTADA
jgi:hypothetical protein